jgi:hypothetical protein
MGGSEHHTLADFRVEKQQELDELFTQVLAALSPAAPLPPRCSRCLDKRGSGLGALPVSKWLSPDGLC